MKQFKREMIDLEGTFIDCRDYLQVEQIRKWADTIPLRVVAHEMVPAGSGYRVHVGAAVEKCKPHHQMTYEDALYFPGYDDLNTVTVRAPAWMMANIFMASKFPIGIPIGLNRGEYQTIKEVYAQSHDIDIEWQMKPQTRYVKTVIYTDRETGKSVVIEQSYITEKELLCKK